MSAVVQEDLMANWKLAVAGEPVFEIDPFFVLSVPPTMAFCGHMNKILVPAVHAHLIYLWQASQDFFAPLFSAQSGINSGLCDYQRSLPPP
jgi:hypothetical protein